MQSPRAVAMTVSAAALLAAGPGGPALAAPEPWTVAAEAPSSDGFRVGFAERDITPDIGMEMPGGYGKSFHSAIHDPCKVRAAVFDDGARRVALVGVDALMVPRHLVLAAREEIRKARGIPPEAILIGASHSHSSGPTGMVQPGEFDDASELVRDLAYGKSSCADARYLETVRREIVAAVSKADESRTAAVCGAGAGTEGSVAFNRRFRMKNGLTWTHPSQGNPEILEAAGPTDPQVGVLGAWSPEGKLLGCVVSYACHATTSPPGISANWIHYMEKAIRGAIDADAVVVFLQGFSGDVTQVDNLGRSAERSGDESARFVGGRIGAEAVKVLLGMGRGSLAPVDFRSSVIRIPRRAPNPERVRRSLETVRRPESEVGHTEWTFAKEIVLLDAILRKEPVADVETQSIQIGPAVLLTSPGETFCALGVDLRGRSPFPLTFPVELANGCAGYIPTEEALGPGGGGYETRLTSYTNLEPKAGTRINAELLRLAGELRPGKAPEQPPAPAFREPWSYGDVPPELE